VLKTRFGVFGNRSEQRVAVFAYSILKDIHDSWCMLPWWFLLLYLFRFCFCVEQKSKKNGENKRIKKKRVYKAEISICSPYF